MEDPRSPEEIREQYLEDQDKGPFCSCAQTYCGVVPNLVTLQDLACQAEAPKTPVFWLKMGEGSDLPLARSKRKLKPQRSHRRPMHGLRTRSDRIMRSIV